MTSKKHGWTKESWLVYKEWANRMIKAALNWYIIRLAVKQMEDRED